MKPSIVILASGGGTTAEAFIRASVSGSIAVEVARIIVSRKDAGIFDRIDSLNRELNLNIACTLVNHQTHPAEPNEVVERGGQTVAEQQAMIDIIHESGANLVVLMGYMKRVGQNLVSQFGWQSGYTNRWQAMMLNTHPGLLPETIGEYGIHVQEHVLANDLPQAGQTLHIVSENYDEGPTVAEHRLNVMPGETADALFDRVQAVEKQFLPTDIYEFIKARQTYIAAQGSTTR